jgi:molybdopterin-binding protein
MSETRIVAELRVHAPIGASITVEAARELGLRDGNNVTAFVKAPDAILGVED